jgi:hypothetical protein
MRLVCVKTIVDRNVSKTDKEENENLFGGSTKHGKSKTLNN